MKLANLLRNCIQVTMDYLPEPIDGPLNDRLWLSIGDLLMGKSPFLDMLHHTYIDLGKLSYFTEIIRPFYGIISRILSMIPGLGRTARSL